MATEAADVDFVTIVPVGEGRPCAKDPSFVTVLTVGANTGAAEIIVRRPRGERLGLGLKFEGGSAAAEKVRRLLVQSCAENSPAANAQAPWGKLIPGDEILAIDGVPVSELTRIDCVRRLKDSDESLTLLVRHFEMDHKVEENGTDINDAAVIPRHPSEIVRPTTLPPPVPPRKLGKKNSFKDKPTLQTVGEQNSSIDDMQQLLNEKESLLNGKHNGISTITKLSRKSSFDSHILRQNKEGINYFKKGSPEEVRRLVRRLSDGKAMPAEAEVYIDLLSSEWERCLVLADAESDDTGSSISTVVDRLGSMTNSVENSIPSTPTMQPKTIDIQKVLNCIENIDTNILKDMTSKNFLEKQINLNNESKALEKPSALNIFNGHDTLNSLSLITDENGMTCKKIYQNDKNNNNAISSNANGIDLIKRNKTDHVMEKPKPMPRNTKIERSASEKKPRTIPIPEISPPSIPDTLLTPTKKNCIETWLQRSEAEMNNKSVEKLEDNTVQEILPRLIDFVPKPQYKEGSSESSTLARPTTAPPPPPTETREDGSGASLDTIGELDETADVSTNVKPLVVIETKTDRKSTFERNFWEDRLNKSDAEDKSLSNDETPLPSCSRQPPDGVETPSDAIEKTPELPSRLPPRLPTAWPTTRSRFSYSSRTQDARSEASVKDKIAMFSNDHAVSTDRIDKCGTLPTRTPSSARKSAATYSSSYSDVSSLDRRLTKSQDNLDDMPKTFKRHSERPEVLGATETVTSSSVFGLSKINKPLQTKSKPLFYGSTTIIPSSPDTSFVQQVYHARSVSEDNSVSTKTNTTAHKSNLEYLIEQRKKSMSKLRGLVIPEVQGPIVDLPEIKVQDPLSKSFLLKSDLSRSNSKPSKPNDTKPMPLNDTKWKVNLLPNNIPKYSPAFKRKSLQVYTPSSLSKESTPERSFNERVEAFSKLNNKTNATHAPRASLDSNGRTITASFSSKALNNTPALPKKDYKDLLNHVRDCKNVEVKMCTATDVIDSDNDSAMSSTQSSYRSSASSPMHALDNVESDNSRLSPKITEYSTYSLVKTEVPSKRLITERSSDEYIKRNVCRSVSSDTNVSLSSSAGSAATSGSQASCSSLESSVADSDKRKVSKAYNIDTINRRNILASAKCRSGRDAKLKSPVVEAKFSHESRDGSPSPVLKPSERLSTLTPPVSALSNKGENRRRNKIIAETDSDSDSDTNIRQRKPDYKNTRLKRNSSSTGKNNKQNESNLGSPKLEDAPKVISEKIIKEINKAGLDDFTTNKVKPLSSNNLNEIVRADKVEIKKEEKNLKMDNSQVKNGRLEMNSGKTTLSKENHLLKPNRAIEFPISNNKTDSSSAEDVQISTQVIRLKRGAGSGVGVILAGGIDCEAKDVTVHRVLADSVAAKAGLKRGVKVRSINGFTMTGLTHAQSVTILKEQRSEVVIEIENEISRVTSEAGCGSDKAESNDRHKYGTSQDKEKSAGSVVSVMLEKAGGGAGLGFGLDGGRDSPRGDCPLTIKKLFAGGAAAQSGRVLVGAELLSAGGQSMEGFTRTQAWAALKALPAGPVCLVLKNPKDLQNL